MWADDDLAVLAEEQRIAVGRGSRSEFARKISVRARTVFDDHRLAKRLAEFGCDHARNRVGGAARGIGYEQADRPAWVLRQYGFRRDCEKKACGETRKLEEA